MFSSTTMLSSTTRPTAMAKPARLMKFREISVSLSKIMPPSTLRGMEMAIMVVGRSVRVRPRSKVGLVVLSRKMKTAVMAKRNPQEPLTQQVGQGLLHDGPVVGYFENFNVWRQLETLDLFQNSIGYFKSIGLGFLDYPQIQAGFTQGSGNTCGIGGTQFRRSPRRTAARAADPRNPWGPGRGGLRPAGKPVRIR